VKQYIIQQNNVWTIQLEVPPPEQDFQHPTQTLSPQIPNLLTHRRWCYLSSKLETYCEQPNCQNLHVSGITTVTKLPGIFQTTFYSYNVRRM